jgi:hypothetical protein
MAGIDSFPNLQAVRLAGFDDELKLGEVSCLQMTQRGLYFSWKARSSITSLTMPINDDDDDEQLGECTCWVSEAGPDHLA